MGEVKTIPSLSRFLLFKKALPYGWHRLRYFSWNSLFKVGIFWLDLLLIFPLLQTHFFVEALLLKIGLNVAQRFWWGALEVMRDEVRENLPRKKVCAQAISRWATLSFILSGALFTGASIWLFQTGVNLFSLYAYVLVFSTCLNLPIRTLHSGAYANARIRRPLWSLCLSPIALLFVAYLSSPFLQELCWPFALLISTLIGSLLSCHFIFKQYQVLSFLPLKLFPLTLPLRSLFTRAFWMGGLSYALMNLNQWIVVAILFSSLSPLLTLHPLTLVMYPLLHLGFEWAQLFYFDLQKTASSPFRFAKKVEKLALKVGFSISAILLFSLLCISSAIGALSLFPVIAFLLIWQVFITIKEIALYTAGDYRKIFLCHALAAAGALLWTEGWIPGTFAAQLLALSAVIAYVKGPFKPRYTKLLAFFDSLHTACEVKESCRIGKIHLCRSATSSQQGAIAKALLEALQKRSAVSCFSNSTILWIEPESECPLNKELICSLGGGLIREIVLGDWKKSGKEALESSFDLTKTNSPSSDEVLALFSQSVPEKEGAFLNSTLSSKVVNRACNFLHFLRSGKPYRGQEIAVLFHPFEDRKLLFSLSVGRTAKNAKQWKEQLVEWNQQLYLKKILEE
jgi:hypothetical protein